MRWTRSNFFCIFLTLFSTTNAALAQTEAGSLSVPGTTLAGGTDADTARINAGALALLRGASLRFTHVSELRAGNTALNGDALTFASPIALGFSGALGVSWVRPERLASTVRAHEVSAEASLAYAIMRTLGAGVRLRITGAAGDAALARDVQLLDGSAALDAGVSWRPYPWLALALVGNNLLGPRSTVFSRDRSVSAGVAVRPASTDVVTIGVDGGWSQTGTGFVRAGLRSEIPYLGWLRAEGAVDLPGVTWRVAAGLEVVWGNWSVGGGGLFGGSANALDGPVGFYASARWDALRERGLPEPSLMVAVELDETPGPRSFARLLLRLDRMRRDPTVRGIVFAPSGDVGGLANAEELREAFARLRASGRRVECHLIEPTGATYYACTGADSIALDTAGTIRLSGVRSTRFFLGDALASVGVHTEFVRIGAWKSAPEQFTRRSSTPEARAQEEQLLDDYYGNLVEGLARSRRWEEARARRVVEGGPYLAREALRDGLVEQLLTRRDSERIAAIRAGGSLVTLQRYQSQRARSWGAGPAVAVLHLDGDIVSGESLTIPYVGVRMVGDETLVPVIEALASNPRIRAVVLRINSPGGDATASEFMWRALAQLARVKPLIVSMGRVGASGGYYVAAPAREVFVNRSTLTGSIGIFYGKADIAPLLSRLQVGTELSRRGPRADMDSMYRAFTPEERVVVTRGIQDFYTRFVERVAAGRHRTPAQINAVGEGRVFTGRRALTVGLADREGGLLAAVDRARELAGLDADSEVLELPGPEPGVLELVRSVFNISDPLEVPAARLLGEGELTQALRWVFTVAWFGASGRMFAMSEWPLGLQ